MGVVVEPVGVAEPAAVVAGATVVAAEVARLVPATLADTKDGADSTLHGNYIIYTKEYNIGIQYVGTPFKICNGCFAIFLVIKYRYAIVSVIHDIAALGN
jgi:hypothetical protein